MKKVSVCFLAFLTVALSGRGGNQGGVSKYGDRMAGGQLLGQKNSAMGIWLANMYLNPLAAVFPALYSVWQNLFNSWQLWMHDRKQR